jgi:hypothetical protein
VPAAKPLKFPVVPVPVIVVDPTDSVTVHVPVAGKPLNATLPVATAHVGWVITPTTGAVGVAGCTLMTALPDATDVHPDALVTVNV